MREKMDKKLIFDAGPLINFSMNGVLYLLEDLHKEFGGEFLITKEVKEEIIDHPLNIKRFQFGALKLKDMFERGVIKHADITKEQVNELKRIRNHLLSVSNETFRTSRKSVHLIDRGEAAALALSRILGNVPLVVDERTTRMIVENPENLRKLLEKKLHTKVDANRKNYELFSGFKIIRSTELVYIINKKNLFRIKDPRVLEAALYGMKYKGCSVSDEEIREIVGL